MSHSIQNLKKKINLNGRKLLLKDYIFYSIFLISIIYSLIYINIPKKSIYLESDTKFEGTLESYTIDGNKLSFVIKSDEKLKCTYYFSTENELNEFKENARLGETVYLEGTLSTPSNNTVPNTFNYKNYLYYHGIFYTCKVSSFTLNDEEIPFLYKIKNYVIGRINKYTDIADYLLTFIIGDKSLIDADVMENYRANGVTHLFAISGMHIGLFSLILLWVLKKMHIGETKRYLITVTFIWFYAFLTSFSPSVLRAGLLFTLLSLNKIFYTEVKTLNVLLLTGSILLFCKPFLLMDIGFIYSFLTTFGLIYGSSSVSAHKWVGTSLVAMLFSLPVTINNFYEFNLLSIFINIIFVPFVSSIIYPLCLLTFIFKFLEPITNIALNILEYVSSLCASINIFHIVMPKMSALEIIIYYLILLFLINKRFRKCLIFITILLCIVKLKPYLNSNFEVMMVDVGQGDSILIRTPHNGKVILIDTGGTISYSVDEWKKTKTYHVSDNTMTYLNSLGISKIDYLILSHGDADHMGESIYFVNNFNVGTVVFNTGTYNNLENSLIELLNEKGIAYYQNLDTLDIGKYTLYFLNTTTYDNENDNSNVIYLEVDNYKFLFMGDASKTKEKDILKKYNLSNIDFLKVGHHGSDTSSGTDFINSIKPKYSLISVGKNNKYGHPKKEALENLESTTIYRTDLDGSTLIKINKGKYVIDNYSP